MSSDRAMANQLSKKTKRVSSTFAFLDRFRPKRLGNQIGYGYLVAISVGWIGSLVGIMVADYFQGQGIFRLLDAQAQTRLLLEFEDTATQAQLQATRVLVLSDHSDEQQQAWATLSKELAALSSLRQDLDDFLGGQPAWLAKEAEIMGALLADYEAALQQYQTQIRLATVNGEAAESAVDVLSMEVITTLDQLHQDLASLIQVAQNQEVMATAVMESLQGLEKLIVIASITVAGLLAGGMAWRTTRAIATPIENITQVARKVTHDADYEARARIFYEDEVGTLARSLNELVERVAERTQALEASAQMAIAQRQEIETTLQALKKAQLQLIQSEKMSSLGQLVAGIAHEVNNPIGFIHSNLTYLQEYSDTLFATVDLLKARLPLIDQDVEKALEEADLAFIRQDLPKILGSIRNGTERINSLILSLKVFSRLQESQVKLANLNDGLESSLVLLGYRLKAQSQRPEIQVSRRYDNLPNIECLSSQMNQVFMNIMNNAIDAIEERWHQSPSNWQPELLLSSELKSDSIWIQIANNGIPIPQTVQEKIFDPFFTTKPVGKGIGLGLSVSYEIVCKKHQGDLTCESPFTGDMGAQFCISIPLSLSAATLDIDENSLLMA